MRMTRIGRSEVMVAGVEAKFRIGVRRKQVSDLDAYLCTTHITYIYHGYGITSL